ncbi:MAG TPA: methylmalonyl Co-A mutase-associated GTPase MeaB, partial [Chitinophagaceae bacterium]
SLVDALIGSITAQGKTVAVLCVDPSSPFHLGALLGDRIRMSEWYNHPGVFIRSLASRGSLGGLHPMIIEIAELVKVAGFDHIIIETVGVGQSEIEIAGLADVTVVVVVPEAGDEVQTMKAGLMEIADIFVVNKSDRPGADSFVKNLRLMLAPAYNRKAQEAEVVKTVASSGEGVQELYEVIQRKLQDGVTPEKRYWLLAERAWHLVQEKRMRNVNKQLLLEKVRQSFGQPGFNLYQLAEEMDRLNADA